jgi:hypothetical protein
MLVLPPIDIGKARFLTLNEYLVKLLSGLNAVEWKLPTVCSAWCVKDIAAHLLDGMLRRLSIHRDGHLLPDAPKSHPELVMFLHQLNADWTRAADRLSPQVLIDLLSWAAPQLAHFFGTLNPTAQAILPVGWAGEQQSQNWFDLAREYTEQWHHQRQIVEAVGRGYEIESRQLYWPVLDTFIRALPHTLRETTAAEGICLRVHITGEAGDTWDVIRQNGGWGITRGPTPRVYATIELPQSIAWLVLTKKWSADEKLRRFPAISLKGDERLGRKALEIVAIMA